jgi:DNA-3-methyladenine glycosylase I
MNIPKSGVATGSDGVARCWWCVGNELYESYHDSEWGRPEADDTRLFEKLCLEGFQAGLSWLTILRKRENFRKAFKGFDVESVARFNQRSVERLMGDAGIVRNRAKIEATINNARRCLDLIDESGSLGAYVWSYQPKPKARPLDWTRLVERGTNSEATAMSKDLKRRGWAFVGPTTVHSFMEAMGLVNDHVARCSVVKEVEAEHSRFLIP